MPLNSHATIWPTILLLVRLASAASPQGTGQGGQGTNDREAREKAERLESMKQAAAEHDIIASELRLLTQPIFRYASTRPDVLDGAIFAFAEATDPEVLLLIEARATEAGYEWQRAFARMTSLPLRARYKNREVWSVTDCWSQVTDRRQPYTAFFRQKVGQ